MKTQFSLLGLVVICIFFVGLVASYQIDCFFMERDIIKSSLALNSSRWYVCRRSLNDALVEGLREHHPFRARFKRGLGQWKISELNDRPEALECLAPEKELDPSPVTDMVLIKYGVVYVRSGTSTALYKKSKDNSWIRIQ